MEHRIITISRQYGSGGRKVGEEIARKLGVSFYDKVLLQLAAEQSGLSPEFLEKSEEQVTSSFLFNLSSASVTSGGFFYQYDIPLGDKAFFAQTSVIKELATREDCVIVGRCADYVLSNHSRCLKVFLHAPLNWRVKWVAAEYNLPEKEAKDRIHRTDKGRANYYRHYTGGTWGDASAYDLCLNTAAAGIEGAVEAIVAMAKTI